MAGDTPAPLRDRGGTVSDSSRRRSHEGAKPPQTPPLGSGVGVGIPRGGDAVRRPFGSATPPRFHPRINLSRDIGKERVDGSLRSHRPSSQSVFWLARRVNYRFRERVGLDLRERRPRRPVVAESSVDPSTHRHPSVYRSRARMPDNAHHASHGDCPCNTRASRWRCCRRAP